MERIVLTNTSISKPKLANLADLQKSLVALSETEREQVLSVFRLDTTSKLTSFDEDVWSVIQKVCATKTPKSSFLKTYGEKNYKTKVEDLVSFISATHRKLRTPQRLTLIEICLQGLAKDILSRNIPLTPTTLLNAFSRVAHSVDQRFPGYAAAGFLDKIILLAA